jgi:hypothetical protein
LTLFNLMYHFSTAFSTYADFSHTSYIFGRKSACLSQAVSKQNCFDFFILSCSVHNNRGLCSDINRGISLRFVKGNKASQLAFINTLSSIQASPKLDLSGCCSR